jgi:hypothetical protein
MAGAGFLPPSVASDRVDHAFDSLRQPRVAGHQCGVERLGEGDVEPVVGGAQIALLPCTAQEWSVDVSTQIELGQFGSTSSSGVGVRATRVISLRT